MADQPIETIQPAPPGTRIHQALFDFDGTISLLRQGWQQVMAPLMIETLAACPQAEPTADLQRLVDDYIAASTGIQTIHQMIWLAEAVAARGGAPREPQEYKQAYLDRLDAHIHARLAAVRAGAAPSEQYMVPGSRAALAFLQEQHIVCHLASGTDVSSVRAEAALLGVDDSFIAIHGAIADWRSYSKAKIIAAILADDSVVPSSLVTFGDGYVEIENTRAAGGVAVGVATNEEHPGHLDPWKRERLIRAGANYIIADLRPVPALLRALGVG